MEVIIGYVLLWLLRLVGVVVAVAFFGVLWANGALRDYLLVFVVVPMLVFLLLHGPALVGHAFW